MASGVAAVTVNGVAATFEPSTGNWMAKLPLVVGSNLVTVEATDRADIPNTGRVQIHVERRNPPPPALSVTYPVNGAFVPNNLITVAGRALSEAAEVSVSVTINGQPATVAGGEFTGTLALVDGPNSISVRATDSLGQTSELSVAVILRQRRPPGVPDERASCGSSGIDLSPRCRGERQPAVDVCGVYRRWAEAGAPDRPSIPIRLPRSLHPSRGAG